VFGDEIYCAGRHQTIRQNRIKSLHHDGNPLK